MGKGTSGLFRNTKGNTPKIHDGRQNKHIPGKNNYKQQIKNGKHPSILQEDPHKLLLEGAGKGTPAGGNKEVVDYGRIIGKYYHEATGRYYDTTRGMIHYDSKGNAQIVPAKPKGFID